MINAIIFDFDGLILDTELPDYESWCAKYQELGTELPFALWATYVGVAQGAFDPYADLEQRLGHPIDRAAVRATRRAHYLELVRAQALLPGVLARLDEAERLGHKLAVASSSSREWVEGHLRERGLLARFQALCCAGGALRAKPNPDVYLAALAALGVEATEALALEDSANGVAAAKAAGLRCIVVPNAVTRQLDLSQADQQVATLEELSFAALAEDYR
jgi:HAD superfamily hydrolase (TIGR01509 family)